MERLTDYRFVSLIHIMMDIIPSLAQVSLVLHKSNIDIAAVKPALDNLMSAFKKADDHSGNTHYQKVINEKLV